MTKKNTELTQMLIPTNTPLVDSFTFRIPLEKCKVIDKRLTSETCIYYVDLEDSDGEILPPKPFIFKENGITLRFALCSIPEFDKESGTKNMVQYVYSTLTTKMLKERYFDGINLHNIYDLYLALLRFEVYTCSYEDFLSSKVSDIDICINRYLRPRSLFPQMLSDLQNATGTKKKYTELTCDANMEILRFKKRQTATPSMPFVKSYNKELEMLTKSAEFWNTYLFPEYGHAIKGLTRVEATIKNYRHKERLLRYNLLPMFNTIDDLLRLSEKQLYNFLTFSINGYIEKKPRKRAAGLSPTDHLIYELIVNSLEAGYDFKDILSIADTWKGSKPSVTPVGKSRMRRKMEELFNLVIHKDIKIRNKQTYNHHIREYFRYLQIEI